MKIHSLVLVLPLLLAACSPPPLEPSAMPAAIEPPPMPSATGLPKTTVTDQPNPTATLLPIDLFLLTVTPLPVPTEVPLPFPTLATGYYHDHDISPDGNWIAWVGAYADFESYPHLVVENLAGDKIWKVTLPEEVHDQVCGTGCWLHPIFWSADGNYLFFYTFPAAMDWPISSSAAKAIMRLSLQSGDVDYVLPPRQNEFYYFGFSPNGEWLVYTFGHKPSLTFSVVNMFTEEHDSFVINIEAELLGKILWSPFDHVFVFHVITNGYSQTEFYVVNIQDFSFRKIYQGDLPFAHFEWYSPKEIILLPGSYSDQPAWIVNIQTGETTPAVATTN
jgi:hypothetical protein